jgi:hypothetical protein
VEAASAAGVAGSPAPGSEVDAVASAAGVAGSPVSGSEVDAGSPGRPARPPRTARLRDPEPDPEPDSEPLRDAPGDTAAHAGAGPDEGPADPAGGGPDRRGRHASLDEDTSSGLVVPFERPARRRWAPWAAAAAAVVLLAGLTAWNVRLRADQDELRQVVAQRSAEVSQRDALVAQRDAAIHQLTQNGPARVAALTANGRPSASRRATVVVRGNQVEIITEGLGASPQNTTYWLWTLRCDSPQPTDLKPIRGFTVPQAQFSVRSIGSDPGFSSATCFAISEELGTATPTAPRTVVAVGQPE